MTKSDKSVKSNETKEVPNVINRCELCNTIYQGEAHKKKHKESNIHKFRACIKKINDSKAISKVRKFIETHGRYYVVMRKSEYDFDEIKDTLKLLKEYPFKCYYRINKSIIELDDILNMDKYPGECKSISIIKAKTKKQKEIALRYL